MGDGNKRRLGGGRGQEFCQESVGNVWRRSNCKGGVCFLFCFAFLFLRLATKSAARSPPRPSPPHTDHLRLSDHRAHICPLIPASPPPRSHRAEGKGASEEVDFPSRPANPPGWASCAGTRPMALLAVVRSRLLRRPEATSVEVCGS